MPKIPTKEELFNKRTLSDTELETYTKDLLSCIVQSVEPAKQELLPYIDRMYRSNHLNCSAMKAYINSVCQNKTLYYCTKSEKTQIVFNPVPTLSYLWFAHCYTRTLSICETHPTPRMLQREMGVLSNTILLELTGIEKWEELSQYNKDSKVKTGIERLLYEELKTLFESALSQLTEDFLTNFLLRPDSDGTRKIDNIVQASLYYESLLETRVPDFPEYYFSAIEYEYNRVAGIIGAEY